jgi:hypothetical protein
MSVHWKSLNTDGKIEAIKAIWEPKMSASDVAERFENVTRNAIIGLFHRHRDKLNPCVLKGRSGTGLDARGLPRKPGARKAKQPKRNKFKQTTVVHYKPLYRPAPIRLWDDGVPSVGRPIMDLHGHQCRWPVNNAKPDELHLFCGLPSRGSYCAHHKARSVYGEG